MLGPDDQIVINGVEMDEFAGKTLQIGRDGLITVPMLGTMKAGGITVREFESALRTKLRVVVRDPIVSVTVTEPRSQPISVLGSVNNAGVHQLRGEKSLTEAIALAGGIRQDAGYKIKIVRQEEWGPIPLKSAHSEEGARFSVAEVNLKDVLDARNPEENIRIMPHDVITVPRGEMVYVVGEVMKAGGFVLNDNESMSVLQALALAGGYRIGAAPKKATVLRMVPGSKHRAEISVNMQQLIGGHGQDPELKPDDILVIPLNAPKLAALRAAEAAIQIGTGIAIWRP